MSTYRAALPTTRILLLGLMPRAGRYWELEQRSIWPNAYTRPLAAVNAGYQACGQRCKSLNPDNRPGQRAAQTCKYAQTLPACSCAGYQACAAHTQRMRARYQMQMLLTAHCCVLLVRGCKVLANDLHVAPFDMMYSSTGV